MSQPGDNSTDFVHERNQLVAQLETIALRETLSEIQHDKSQPPRVVQESYAEQAPRRHGFDETPRSHSTPVMPDIASDRANGDFWPIFNNEWDLAIIRGVARHLEQTDCGQGVLGNLQNYIVHTGFDYQATAIRGQDAPENLVQECQRIIDSFLSNNRWELDFERELITAESVDGETIIALEADGDQVRARRAEPSWLTEPADKDYLERRMGVASALNWRYGIATDQADATKIHGYFVQWNGDPTAWRFYTPARIVHLKSNTPRHVKRGLTDFFPVSGTMGNAMELLRRMTKGATIQASIAMIVEAATGTGSLGIGDASQLGGTLARGTGGTGQRLNSAGNYVSERRSDWYEGMVIDTRGKKFQAGPMAGTQAANFVQVLQASLRSAGVRWNMPEHMISGDASNNNYASILESGSPFVRRIESEQEKLYKAFERMLWAVLRMYFEMGRLNLRRYGIGWQELRRCVNLIVTGTSPAVRNRLEDFQVDSMLHDKGLVSDDTLAAKYDYDPEEEREKGAKPRASMPLAAPAGFNVQSAKQAATESWNRRRYP